MEKFNSIQYKSGIKVCIYSNPNYFFFALWKQSIFPLCRIEFNAKAVSVINNIKYAQFYYAKMYLTEILKQKNYMPVWTEKNKERWITSVKAQFH